MYYNFTQNITKFKPEAETDIKREELDFNNGIEKTLKLKIEPDPEAVDPDSSNIFQPELGKFESEIDLKSEKYDLDNDIENQKRFPIFKGKYGV